MQTEPRRYLTTGEVATRLGKAQRTVMRWADDGKLRIAATTADGTRLFDPADVAALLADEVAKLEALAAALKAAS